MENVKILPNIRLPMLLALVGSALLSGCAALNPSLHDYQFRYDEGTLRETRSADGDCSITANGKISVGFGHEFANIVKRLEKVQCKTKTVYLNSTGGLVVPALQAGALIRKQGYSTAVAEGSGKCQSACGFIYIAGVERISRGRNALNWSGNEIGLHQISRKDASDGSKSCLTGETMDAKIVALMRRYIGAMLPKRGAEAYFKSMMETDCQKIRFFTPEELLSLGISTRS
jgi:hypothetical protein